MTAGRDSSDALYEAHLPGGQMELEVANGELALGGRGETRKAVNGRPTRFHTNGNGASQVIGYSTGAVAAVDTAIEPKEALALATRYPVGAAAKRIIDIVASTLAIVLLIPLWLAIAVAIKLDSPGPVLFRQRRIGRGERPFRMLKFRTMVNGADAQKRTILHLNEAGDGLFKISRDPRMTTVGRFLRSTCLDELPQLLHVLTGQMSLVGPRPLVPEEDDLIPGYCRRRMTARPGITGVWQSAGAGRFIPLAEMAEMDLGYLENWSLRRDLRILWRTAPLVFKRRGV